MSTKIRKILVADDEEGMRFVLDEVLNKLGYQVLMAEDGEQAMRIVREEDLDLAILDINMPKIDGMKVLEEARRLQPDLICLIMTAYGSTDLAMRAIRLGAYDYFTKPFDIQELRTTILRALEKRQLVEQIHELESQVSGQGRFREIIGGCEAMQEVFTMMERVIDTDVPVLIAGESGTGKEMVAQAIHTRGARSSGPLVKINCAAIPESLLESELFGHEKGSFTGATETRPGRFEQADKGTLFLDEIGEMPIALQPKILRAVQEGEVQRVGGKNPVRVNVRLITATNRDLAQEVAAKRFREDLYFRINVIAIELPPLRKRLSDMPQLVEYFIQTYNKRMGKTVIGIAHDAMSHILEYRWPGNIRELENVIQRALIMATGNEITVEDLPPHVVLGESPTETREANTLQVNLGEPLAREVERMTEMVETQMIREALKAGLGRQETAEHLGISRKSLHNKMQKYDIKD